MGKRRNLKENAKNFKRLIISHLVSFGFLWILGSSPFLATKKPLKDLSTGLSEVSLFMSI